MLATLLKNQELSNLILAVVCWEAGGGEHRQAEVAARVIILVVNS